MPSARLLRPVVFAGALSATALFVACDGVELSPGDDLNRQLHAALQDAGGANAFILPRGDDFAAIPQDPRNQGTEDRWRDGSPQSVNRLGYAGLEAQAIAALETHRMSGGAEALAYAYPSYRQLFDAAFPDWPEDRRISRETAGLAIAAYERTLIADRASFQRWLRGETDALSDAEKRGALLFFGRAACVQCHSGPSLGSATFHALGMGDLQPTVGRFDLADPLHFGRGAFTGRDEDNFRFKTPQLYNVSDRPALGHGATFASVRHIVDYKNAAVAQNRYVSVDRLSPLFRPLSLAENELQDLTAFIERGLRDPDLARYVPTELPSGNCFPANDPQSRRDLGCGAAGK